MIEVLQDFVLTSDEPRACSCLVQGSGSDHSGPVANLHPTRDPPHLEITLFE
jgi:hypothetical protein